MNRVTPWIVLYAALCSIGLVAQTNGVPIVPGTAGAFAGSQFYVDLLSPLASLVIAALVTKFKPQMTLPLLAAVTVTLGTISSALATVVIGTGIQSPMNVVKAAALALGGVLVKVLVDKLGPEKPAQ